MNTTKRGTPTPSIILGGPMKCFTGCHSLNPLNPNPMNDKIDLKRYGQWVSVIGSTRLNQEIDNLTFITENLPIFSNEAAELATKKLNYINATNGKYHGWAKK